MRLHPKAFITFSDGTVSVLSRSDARTTLRMPASVIARHLGGEQLDALLPSSALRILRQHFLLSVDEDDSGGKIGATWPDSWGELSRMHFLSTSNARYVTDPARAKALEVEVATDECSTSTFSSWAGSERFALPAPDRISDSDFFATLSARRTTRLFKVDQPVDLQAVADLLWWACRPTRIVDGGPFGPLPFYTSPHAGARNDIECYVVLPERIDPELEPGIYHYSPIDHVLELIAAYPGRDAMKRMFLNSHVAATAPVFAVFTSRIDRLAEKYRDARTERLVFLNAGHRAQTFALCATALGLGIYQSAAFNDRELSQSLLLAPLEKPTYVLAIGHRDPGDPYSLPDSAVQPSVEIRGMSRD